MVPSKAAEDSKFAHQPTTNCWANHEGRCNHCILNSQKGGTGFRASFLEVRQILLLEGRDQARKIDLSYHIVLIGGFIWAINITVSTVQSNRSPDLNGPLFMNQKLTAWFPMEAGANTSPLSLRNVAMCAEVRHPKFRKKCHAGSFLSHILSSIQKQIQTICFENPVCCSSFLFQHHCFFPII